jgi:hypothetical protein
MNFAKRIVIFAGCVVLAAIFVSVLAPKATHALVATLVQVANTSSNPVPTLEQEAQSAFVAQGTCQMSFQACAVGTLYTVPAGKTAVLESVAFNCILIPSSGTSPSGVQTEAGSLTFSPPGGGQNVTLQLPPGNPFLLPNGVIQSAAQNVKSYAAGGSSGGNIFLPSLPPGTRPQPATARSCCRAISSSAGPGRPRLPRTRSSRGTKHQPFLSLT